MMPIKYSRIGLVLLVAIYLNGCLTQSNNNVMPAKVTESPQPNMVDLATPGIVSKTTVQAPSTPTFSPSPTLSPSVGDLATPTIVSTKSLQATLTPTHSPDPAHTLSNDLLLNLGSEFLPLWTCLAYITAPGEIWLSKFPYETSKPVLADPQVSYYNPLWSPDGNWISYVAVAIHSTKVVTLTNVVANLYLDSDSVWIMRSDGKEKKQLGKPFTRVDANSADGGCEVYSGINSFSGWSYDSKWLAFDYFGFNSQDIPSSRVLVNVETDESREIQMSGEAEWAPDKEMIAQVNNKDSRLEIYDLEHEIPDQVILPFPDHLPDSYGFSGIQWGNSSDTIFLLGGQRPHKSTLTIWAVNTRAKTWEKIFDLGAADVSRMKLGGSFTATCQGDYGREILLRETGSWELVRTIPQEEGIDCSSFQWVGDQFTVYEFLHPKNILVGNPLNPDTPLVVLVSGERLRIPDEYEIVQYSWKP